MFELENGRKHFYQWDTGQRLIIDDATVVEAHFCNRTDDCSLTCEVYTDGGKRVVDVPNILLQDNWDIRVYAYCGNYTKVEERYEVVRRSKPADYVYTETETKTYNTLENRIEALEEQRIENGVNTVNGKAGDVVLTAADIGALGVDSLDTAIDESLSRAKESGEFDGKQGEDGVGVSNVYQKTTSLADGGENVFVVELTDGTVSNFKVRNGNKGKEGYTPVKTVDYWTDNDKAEMVAETVAAIPPTDLSNYYTKAQTNTAIKNAQPDLTPYAEKTELEGLATETYVSNAIAAIPPTDLSNYYTKTQTNSKITTSLSGYAKETYVNTKIADLVGTAPETLDTLGEIATALEDNSEVIDTLNQAIGTKANKTDLNGLATETYVSNAISAIPPTDLSNYYTKTQTNSQITTALSPYAKKTELPSTAGLASETYVDEAIAAIPPTDLSNYYTKAQTNTAITNAKPDLTPYATKANSETWTFTLKDGTTLTKKVVLA